jgi:hypothetical protein
VQWQASQDWFGMRLCGLCYFDNWPGTSLNTTSLIPLDGVSKYVHLWLSATPVVTLICSMICFAVGLALFAFANGEVSNSYCSYLSSNLTIAALVNFYNHSRTNRYKRRTRSFGYFVVSLEDLAIPCTGEKA